MSNFPLPYQLAWAPRFLRPSLRGDRRGFAPPDGAIGPADAKTVRLIFVGDISAVANRASPWIDPRLQARLASADLVIGNCESPVVRRTRAPIATRIGQKHAMTPDFLDAVLEAAAVAPDRLVLSLANNHALDQGVDGFDETQDHLSARGIRSIGAAADGFVQNVRTGEIEVGFSAFTAWRNAGADDYAGRVTMAADFERDGWAALKQAKTDIVCAVPHWDVEFLHFPQAKTRALARRLATGGVSLVAGHHAHVLQPIERIGDALAAYGLGDFLGTAWKFTTWPLKLSAMLSVDVATSVEARGRIVRYDVVPFVRLRQDKGERLVPIEALHGRVRERLDTRIETIFGAAR